MAKFVVRTSTLALALLFLTVGASKSFALAPSHTTLITAPAADGSGGSPEPSGPGGLISAPAADGSGGSPEPSGPGGLISAPAADGSGGSPEPSGPGGLITVLHMR